MDDTPLRYDVWVEQALRGVIRRALDHVAAEGLPGDHHFYLTFKTTGPGVVLADALREKYPDEMTVVLQHQFWNLATDDEAVEVTLAFSGVRQTMRIPFGAVTAFADPAVNFGLQLKTVDDGEDAVPAGLLPPAPEAEGKRRTRKRKAAKDKESAAADTSGEVIALDSFRKK